MDRLVCRLSSVLCSVEIVKRVVTVKQVRPSPLRGVRLDLEHGYACCRCASIGRGLPVWRRRSPDGARRSAGMV